jgi:hypothetical protein
MKCKKGHNDGWMFTDTATVDDDPQEVTLICNHVGCNEQRKAIVEIKEVYE